MGLLPAIAMLFALVCVFAFTPAQKTAHTTDTYFYVYSGTTTDLSDYQDSGNWGEAQASDPGGCNGGSSLPCVVTSSIDNKTDFVQSITSASVVDNNVADYRH